MCHNKHCIVYVVLHWLRSSIIILSIHLSKALTPFFLLLNWLFPRLLSLDALYCGGMVRIHSGWRFVHVCCYVDINVYVWPLLIWNGREEHGKINRNVKKSNTKRLLSPVIHIQNSTNYTSYKPSLSWTENNNNNSNSENYAIHIAKHWNQCTGCECWSAYVFVVACIYGSDKRWIVMNPNIKRMGGEKERKKNAALTKWLLNANKIQSRWNSANVGVHSDNIDMS